MKLLLLLWDLLTKKMFVAVVRCGDPAVLEQPVPRLLLFLETQAVALRGYLLLSKSCKLSILQLTSRFPATTNSPTK